MSDEIYNQLKERQARWMRERAIEIEKQSIGDCSISSADLVNKLTDRITSKMQGKLPAPKVLERIDKSVADELETNTCGICFELMLPKDHSPMLLFPCGHTFCKKCLEDNEKKTGRQICPWCRAKITSCAVNLSLQNIIVAYAKNKNIKVAESPAVPNSAVDYSEQLNMYNLRCEILREERYENERKAKELENEVNSHHRTMMILQEEARRAEERLKAAQAEYNLVQSFIEENNRNVENLSFKISEHHKTIQLIDETLEPLDKEREKISLLIKLQK
jgi:hypothetical protein